MTKKLAIIDGKSIFYRGYYAMSNLTTSDGTSVGGVYGFAAMAIELFKKYQPDYVAVAWDKSKTNIRSRKKIYPGYKAGRKPAPPDFYAQIPILRELLSDFGWPLYEADDFEADDIIGTLAEQADKHGGIDTLMISSDLDMLQIVDHNTRLYALKKGFTDIEEFDVQTLEAKYGIKKEQFLDLKALKGDSSDNIPGVPGIGEKTAVILLQEYKTLDNIYKHLDDIKPAWSKKLINGKELAYTSKQLGQIQFNAPVDLNLDEMDVKNLNTERLNSTLDKLEFRSLLKRLPEFMKNDKSDKELIEDVPGLYFILPDKKIVVNDGKALCEKLLKLKQPLPDIEFDTRIAGFLLGRIEPAGNESDLRELYEKQQQKLSSEPKLLSLAKDIDFPMQKLLAEIETRGVKLDGDGLSKLSDEFESTIKRLEQQIWECSGAEFNIASPAQLSTILFDNLNLPTAGIKRGKSGVYSTGKKELSKLSGQHKIIELIGEFREVSKLKNTYVDALPRLADSNGRLHTTFQQDVTATGRLSSSNPNLQNIPVRSKLGKVIRKNFIANEGKILISADYSQFELRLAAALAGDKDLIKIFNNDTVDIHKWTAADAYGIEPEDVTEEQRRNAKVINFGVLYGMSPHGLSAATGMSFSAAKDFIEKYFTARQPIRRYLDETIKSAEENGYVETLFGRRRPTPNVRAGNFAVREAAKRQAANMPVQGTEADLMKLSMLKIDHELREVAPQILQIHDSIMVETSPTNVTSVSEKMRNIMENIYPDIGVKLKVDIKTGKNWGDL